MTYFDRTACPPIKGPEVVEIERNHLEHRNIKQDLPSREQPPVRIQPSAPSHLHLRLRIRVRRRRRQNQGCHASQGVAPAQLVGEQNPNVEDPDGERDVLSRQAGGDLVVDAQDR